MSKQVLKSIFEKLTECKSWTLQIIKVKASSSAECAYICRKVNFESNNDLIQAVKDIEEFYCSKKGIESFSSVDAYKGDVVDHVIYKLHKSNELISKDYDALIKKTALPDKEIKISELKPNCVMFKGSVISEDKTVPVYLFSVQKPITTLNNKFVLIEPDTFRKLTTPVLTLKKTIDVAIIGDTVYLFSLAGENLFNMERTYKSVCKAVVDNIEKCDFLTDPDYFSEKANSGRNPRRFISYNNKHFEWLKKKENRETAEKQFGLVLENGRIKTTDEESVERLVKFLCDKAMVDPCDMSAKEVSAAKPWR